MKLAKSKYFTKVSVDSSPYYRRKYSVELTPLTILVGEKDTGKTSFVYKNTASIPLSKTDMNIPDVSINRILTCYDPGFHGKDRLAKEELIKKARNRVNLGAKSIGSECDIDPRFFLSDAWVAAVMPGTNLHAFINHPAAAHHPRVQAAVGSFLVRMVKEGRGVIVETHSDYLVDRVCIEVMKDPAFATSVSILSFAKKSKISQIKLDKDGNLIGQPNNYRKWFLEEQSKYLGA